MADVRCTMCGREPKGEEQWMRCEDCDTNLCPDCLEKSDQAEGMLQACPRCGGKLTGLDWT